MARKRGRSRGTYRKASANRRVIVKRKEFYVPPGRAGVHALVEQMGEAFFEDEPYENDFCIIFRRNRVSRKQEIVWQVPEQVEGWARGLLDRMRSILRYLLGKAGKLHLEVMLAYHV